MTVQLTVSQVDLLRVFKRSHRVNHRSLTEVQQRSLGGLIRNELIVVEEEPPTRYTITEKGQKW